MARRTPPETRWPEDQLDRLDLESVFAHGDPRCLPTGWNWRAVRMAWQWLGAEFLAGLAEDEECWALHEWGSPR
jgi:hypothetical protein